MQPLRKKIFGEEINEIPSRNPLSYQLVCSHPKLDGEILAKAYRSVEVENVDIKNFRFENFRYDLFKKNWIDDLVIEFSKNPPPIGQIENTQPLEDILKPRIINRISDEIRGKLRIVSESESDVGYDVPIEYVSEDNAEQYMRKLLAYKRLYDEIKENHYETRIDEAQKADIFDVLKISDFSRDYLHTILLFNDIAKSKLFNRATNYFNQLLPICRHIQCSFFLNVQFWKSLPPEIKANATTIIIFGGFDVRQLYYIFSQVPTALSVKEILPEYRLLNKHDKIVVDCELGDVYVDSSLD